MREWLDSAGPPNAAQIAQAKAAGYAGWAGYFKFGNDGVLNGWADSDFQRVLAGGLRTLAYCSGWADALQVKLRAKALGIAACLDDESGMRPDGFWVPAWLAAAGAGLYGNSGVHIGRTAALHVLADYPLAGDPGGESWPNWLIRPSGPVAWQWAGSHSWAGITVDSTWADDAFPGAFGSGIGELTGSHSQLIHSEDSPVAIIVHPTVQDRVDIFAVGRDGNITHTWGNTDQQRTGIGGGAETLGLPPGGGTWRADGVSVVWYASSQPSSVTTSETWRLVVAAIRSSDGAVFIRETDYDGRIVKDWSEVMVATGGGPAALQVEPLATAPDDDSPYLTKQALQRAIAGLA